MGRYREKQEGRHARDVPVWLLHSSNKVETTNADKMNEYWWACSRQPWEGGQTCVCSVPKRAGAFTPLASFLLSGRRYCRIAPCLVQPLKVAVIFSVHTKGDSVEIASDAFALTVTVDIEHSEGLLEVRHLFFCQVSVCHGVTID